MSFLVYYILLHLCVSIHACSSHDLGVLHKEPGRGFRLDSKMPKIHELKGENGNGNHMKQKESTIGFLEGEENMHTGYGSDIKVQVSKDETKIDGWKKHAQLTKQQDSKEVINNSKDNSFTEDVVVMDYAQPHRKPPIHNLEP